MEVTIKILDTLYADEIYELFFQETYTSIKQFNNTMTIIILWQYLAFKIKTLVNIYIERTKLNRKGLVPFFKQSYKILIYY